MDQKKVAFDTLVMGGDGYLFYTVMSFIIRQVSRSRVILKK